MNNLMKISGGFASNLWRCHQTIVKTLRNRRVYHALSNNCSHAYESAVTQITCGHKVCINLSINRCLAKGKDKPKHGKKGGKPRMTLTDEEMEQVIPFSELRIEIDKVVESLKNSFDNNLMLRNNPSSINNLLVDVNGTKYPLSEIATIGRKSSHLVVLNLTAMPEALKPVLAAIADSGMNLNPQQESTVIYLTIPTVTREHREKLAANAKVLLQNAKDEFRQVYSAFTAYASRQRNAGISAELIYNVNDNLKYLIDQKIIECERLLENKLNELLK